MRDRQDRNLKRVLILIILVFLFSAFVCTASVATTWYVHPGELIQGAVNMASDGDTIIVKDGTYKENVEVNKRLTVRSEKVSEKCIVQAFAVTADYVNLSGFTIEGATSAGIRLREVEHCNILNNRVSGKDYGIYLDKSNDNVLNNINAYSNRHGFFVGGSDKNSLTNNRANSNSYTGIYLTSSNGNILVNNTALRNDYGIRSSSSYDNNLIGNIVSNNNEEGIQVSSSNRNILSNNSVEYNEYDGIRLSQSDNNILSNNSVEYNEYDGIGLWDSNNNILVNNSAVDNKYRGIYLENSISNILTNNSADENRDQGIHLKNSNNSALTDNAVSNNGDNGIYLHSSSSNTLARNKANSNKCHGIRLSSSNDNTLSRNSAESNKLYGIHLSSSNSNILNNNTASHNHQGIRLSFLSNSNILSNNSAISNNDYGIYLGYSNNNTLTYNDFTNNDNGSYMYESSSNKIYLNNFINNVKNVYSENSTNIWNSTEKITYTYLGTTYESYLGNYWSDYEEKYPDADEIDATGIWDTPYSIDGDKDNYPLMESFENDLQDFVSHYYPLKVSVTVAIDPVAPENYSQVTVRVTTTEGMPLSDVSVSVSATGGSLSPTSGTTDSKGEFKSTYRAPIVTKTQTYTISATASKAGYISSSGTATITVKTLLQSETVIIPSWEDPLVKIENQANRDVTVTFTGPTSATIYLECGTTESKRFTPGDYTIHATAIGASPATIRTTLSKGYMYTLRIFEIVIRSP
jgi:parallel beta-helix repeat protein